MRRSERPYPVRPSAELDRAEARSRRVHRAEVPAFAAALFDRGIERGFRQE